MVFKNFIQNLKPIVHQIIDNKKKFTGNSIFAKIVDGKKLKFMQYENFVEKIENLSIFFRKNYANCKIGIIAQNSVEWVIIDLAIQYSGNITVPIYCNMRKEDIKHIIQECALSLLFVGDEYKENISGCETVKITNDIYMMHKNYACENKKINFNYAHELDKISTIVYTSGTTSSPKGVIMTHRNILKSVYSFQYSSNNNDTYSFSPSDRYLSYLPIAHILERLIHYLCIINSTLIINNNDKRYLIKNMKIFKPTIFLGVPLVFDKIVQNIPKILQFLLKRIGKYFFFNFIRNKFGGKVRFVFTGSAHMSNNTNQVLKGIFKNVYQGYGLTESIGSISMETYSNNSLGSVGRAIEAVNVKIENDEILICGNNFVEYYTKEIFSYYLENIHDLKNFNYEFFHKNKWFKTGDLGYFKNNNLYISGRRSSIFKLTNGEFISPERIENIMHKFFDDILIYGESSFYRPVCFVNTDRTEKEILACFKNNSKILPYEIPDKIFIIKDFIEAGLRTKTTFKLKRSSCKNFL